MELPKQLVRWKKRCLLGPSDVRYGCVDDTELLQDGCLIPINSLVGNTVTFENNDRDDWERDSGECRFEGGNKPWNGAVVRQVDDHLVNDRVFS